MTNSPSSLTRIQDDARFQNARLIGRGAAGDVYVATDIALSRLVAIKHYRDFDGHSSQHLGSILKLVASLRHPGIAQVVDVIRTQTSLQLVQTYCANGPLSVSLRESETDVESIAEVFMKICDAVSYMHNRGIVHCDLKLANILRSDNGDPVLIDFDHCRELGSAESVSFVGTPAYMAPELIQQRAPASVATEVFALELFYMNCFQGNW
ncbi:MAG: serine/threonine-protein kinase [Pirellulaceae bacterium]